MREQACSLEHVSHHQLWDRRAQGLGVLLCDEDGDVEGLSSPDQPPGRVYDGWVALDGGTEPLLYSRNMRSASLVVEDAQCAWLDVRSNGVSNHLDVAHEESCCLWQELAEARHS